MPKNKSRRKKGVKKYQIELTSISVFFWSFCLLFLLSWIFILGILVGRGFLPGEVTAISDLKNQISKLKEITNRKNSVALRPKKDSLSEPKLAFYEKLASKKEEAIKMRLGERKEEALQKTQPQKKEKKRGGIQNQAGQSEALIPEVQYTVQVASLTDKNIAEKMVNRLMDKGYPAYFYEVKLKGRTYYRVRCRKFLNRKDAEKYLDKLEREEEIKGFVTRVE
ncbi:MAG: SPOR domain-containing protein [Thermodesulfobacteriota bacterium]|nr:SPOR domain-containing protein [Thermodesulfobacteriota bacterium]